jgi:hypothetical protein
MKLFDVASKLNITSGYDTIALILKTEVKQPSARECA